jgi:hypothetical protein
MFAEKAPWLAAFPRLAISLAVRLQSLGCKIRVQLCVIFMGVG